MDIDENAEEVIESTQEAEDAAQATPAAEPSPAVRGVTGALRKTTHMVRSAQADSPQKFLLVVIAAVAAAVIFVLIMVVFVSRSQDDQPRPQRPDFTSNIGIDQDSSSRVQAFIRAQERRSAELERDLERAQQEFASQKATQERLIRELAEGRQRAHQEAAEANRKLSDASRLLEEAATRQVPVLVGEHAAREATGTQRYEAFIQSLRQQHAAGNLTASDARMRLRRRLIDNEGYDPADVERVIDAILERLGVLYVGQVAEPAPTPEQIAQLPGRLSEIFEEVQQFVYQKGTFEGHVLPRMADIKRMVHVRYGAETYTDEQVSQLALLARVRLENVTPSQEEQLGRLVAARERRTIDHTDMVAIETLVWSQRERLPGLTPGQHLALIGAVARARGAPGTTQEDRSLRSPTDDDMDVAMVRVRRAIDQAQAQGVRDQSGLLLRARRALERFLSDGRIEMSQTQQDSIVLVAVQEAVQPRSEPRPSRPDPDDHRGTWRPQDQRRDTERRPAPVVEPPPPPQLRLGHLVVGEAQAAYVAWLLVPYVADGVGLQPDTPSGAAGIVAMWSQAAALGDQAFALYAHDAQGARRWYETVVRHLVEVGMDGVTFANNDLRVPDAPDDVHPWVAAILVAERLANLMDDGAESMAAYRVLEESVRERGPFTPQVAHAVTRSARLTPWMRLAVVRKALSPEVVPFSAGRSASMVDALVEMIPARRAALTAQITGGDEHVQVVTAQVQDDLELMLPMAVAMAMAVGDQARIAIPEVRERTRVDTAQFATLLTAEARVMQVVTSRMMRPYVAQISSEGGGIPAVLGTVRTAAPGRLLTLWNRQRPAAHDDAVVPLAMTLSDAVLPDLEQLLVRAVVLTNVEPRIQRSGRAFDQQVVDEAVRHVVEAAESLVEAPYTTQRINAWIMDLQEQGMDVLAGRRMAGAAGRPGRQGDAPEDAAPGPRMAFPAVVPARTSGAPIGLREVRRRDRQIMLNAGTYANAYLTTGVSAEVGGEGNIPILLEMPVTFHGPGGGQVHMPAVRFIGQANPRAGAERLSVQLVRMSYRFPNGRAIDKEVNGYVADAVDGVEGAIGQFRLNADKVLPAAVAAGFLQGAGEALNQNATTVEVTAGATTTVSETGSTLQRALLGGSSEGATIIGDYIRQYMDDVRPTVSAPNGQPVTIILLDPVVFDDVTDAEWASLRVDTAGHGF